MQIRVKVNAGSSSEGVRLLEPGFYQVRTRAPAQDGKANTRVLELLAGEFDVGADRVRIITGHGKPLKLVEIDLGAG